MEDKATRRRRNVPADQKGGSVAQTETRPTKSGESAKADARRPYRIILKTFGALLSCVCLLLLWKQSPATPAIKSEPPKPQVAHKIVADVEKQRRIVESFKHAWDSYETNAWGSDEYHPLSRTGSNISQAGGIGYMIVDAIDTLQLMGLSDEYERARAWVASSLTFDRPGKFNAFEITIRVLGGLLSAFHLSDDEMFLEKATQLGDRLMPIFRTPSGIPMSFIDLGAGEGIADEDNNWLSSTAEAATLQLELKYLSYLTEDYSYWKAAEKVMRIIKTAAKGNGIVPIFIRADDGEFMAAPIRFGSRGDSYYEYLLKQYLQTDRTEHVYREMYDHAMAAMHNQLVRRTPNNNVLYIAELVPEVDHSQNKFQWRVEAKQDHLVCFLGGSLLLGATEASASVPPDETTFSPSQRRDWNIGKELIDTCAKTHDTKTGLSPEIAHFRTFLEREEGPLLDDWYIKVGPDGGVSWDARYILRPETVESLFIAYRLTGSEDYRALGWKIYEAIEKYCKLPDGGYASIMNVDGEPDSIEWDDKMETFFLSETLKYLYLLFSSDDVLPLSKYVFNTEAHPFPIFTPTFQSNFD